jgi:hypothetical protein
MKLFLLFLLLVWVFILGLYTGHNSVVNVLENQHNIVNVIEPIATYKWVIAGLLVLIYGGFYLVYSHFENNK